MLSVVAGSVITVAGVGFSITIVTLTRASSQFGPRLLRTFMRDRGNQFVLGTWVGTFIYGVLVYFIDHVSYNLWPPSAAEEAVARKSHEDPDLPPTYRTEGDHDRGPRATGLRSFSQPPQDHRAQAGEARPRHAPRAADPHRGDPD